jgi:hypothetical protein
MMTKATLSRRSSLCSWLPSLPASGDEVPARLVGSTLLGAWSSKRSGPPASLSGAGKLGGLRPIQPEHRSASSRCLPTGGRDVLLLGEQHDDADHHQWQLQVLAGLHALRPEMIIGFEMFPRRVQPVLDRWVPAN